MQVIREEIGFDNLIMTDDISMKALQGSLTDLSRAALEAGCDVILHCNGSLDARREVAEAAGPMSFAAQTRALRALNARIAPDELDIPAARAQLLTLVARGLKVETGRMADTPFEEDKVSVADRLAAEALIVDVDGFEGPLDLLADAEPHAEGRSAQDFRAGAGAAVSGLRRKRQDAAARTGGGLSRDGGLARLPEIAAAAAA